MKIGNLFKGFTQRMARLSGKKGGFGMNELLGIAAALILAAFIIIPQLQQFAEGVMKELHDWWDHTITSEIFQSAPPGN